MVWRLSHECCQAGKQIQGLQINVSIMETTVGKLIQKILDFLWRFLKYVVLLFSELSKLNNKTHKLTHSLIPWVFLPAVVTLLSNTLSV